MLRSLLTCALTAQAAFAAPYAGSTFAAKDTHNAPAAWLRTGRADPDQLIRLNIGLTQGRFDELERNLYEISDPSHHRYGKHLSAEDVNELIKPKDEAIEAVHEWLKDVASDSKNLNIAPQRTGLSLLCLPKRLSACWIPNIIVTSMKMAGSLYEQKPGPCRRTCMNTSPRFSPLTHFPACDQSQNATERP